MMLYDFRISAVTTKDLLELPVVVNQEESELLLMKTPENPYLWYDTEFERDLEIAGMINLPKSSLTTPFPRNGPRLANRTAASVADLSFVGLIRKLKTWMTRLQARLHL